MWSFLSWLFEYWLLFIWGAGIVVAYIYGGRYAALVVATLGFGSFMYNRGKFDVNKTPLFFATIISEGIR